MHFQRRQQAAATPDWGSGAGVGDGTSDASAKVPDHFAFKVFFDYGRSGGSDEFLMVQLSGLQRDAP